MATVDADFVVQAAIGLLVITAPFDPVKLLFFNQVLTDQPQSRTGAALKVTLYVSIILVVSAAVGKELLEAIGINLHVFGAIGGLLIAAMGVEMLYGGGASKAQGKDEREKGPEEGDGLLIPLSIPLIAGPGAIATTIAFGSQNTSVGGLVAMGVAIVAVALVTFLFYRYMGGLLARLKPSAVAILARIGGLLLATLGFQMFLGGLKSFFG
jgi:multiple antibiotic resistance protein